MRRKGERSSAKVSRAREKAAKATSAKKRAAAGKKMQPTEEHFIRGVLIRGEAAKPTKGKLPPRVTHEIVEEKEGVLPKIRRRRFSIT